MIGQLAVHALGRKAACTQLPISVCCHNRGTAILPEPFLLVSRVQTVAWRNSTPPIPGGGLYLRRSRRKWWYIVRCGVISSRVRKRHGTRAKAKAGNRTAEQSRFASEDDLITDDGWNFSQGQERNLEESMASARRSKQRERERETEREGQEG